MDKIDAGFITASGITSLTGLRRVAALGVMHVQVPVIFTQGAWYVGTTDSVRIRIERMVEEARHLRVGLKVLVTAAPSVGRKKALKHLRNSLRSVCHTICVTTVVLVRLLRSLDREGVRSPVSLVVTRDICDSQLEWLAKSFVTLSINLHVVDSQLVRRFERHQRIGSQVSIFPITTIEEAEGAWEQFQRQAILITPNPEVFMHAPEALKLSTA